MPSCLGWFSAVLVGYCAAFPVTPSGKILKTKNFAFEMRDEGVDRRSVFKTVGVVLLGFEVLGGAPGNAAARDELFKKNPLTNPLLEQIRILEQAEKDNIQYDGELAAGDSGNKGKVDQYPKLLVPILKIDEDLRRVETLVHGSRDDWREAAMILQQPQYVKREFKRIFNDYADNIYYSDPDRANLYLGGGTTPKSEQSLAYLLRNEILTNIEALQAELEYLLKENDNETEDLYKFSADANAAMVGYLKNVSPKELKQARDLMASER